MDNVRSFLISAGLIAPHDLPTSQGEFRLTCPECHNPKEKFYVNGLGRGVHCKHCGYSASWRGYTRRYEPPTIEEEAIEDFVTSCQHEMTEEVEEYLLSRGLIPEVISKARIGYCLETMTIPPSLMPGYIKLGLVSEDRMFLANRIIFPYIRDGFVETVRGRSADSATKYLSLPHSKGAVYAPFGLDTKADIIICEGEIDQLTLAQAGYNAGGIPGVNHYKLVEDLAALGGKIYICFDGDQAGHEASVALTKKIPEIRIVDLPDEVDVNEYIQAFGEDSFQKLYEGARLFIEAKEQQPDDLKIAIDAWSDWAFTNTELLGPKILWAPRLQQALSGWSNGLFLLGAIQNSGKSCLLVKSAYHAAIDNPMDTVVCYLSLDDDQEDCLTRLVSLATGINFEQVRSPRYSFDNPNGEKKPELMKLFFETLEELKQIENLYIRDSKYGRSLGYVRNYIATMRKRNPNKHLFVIIDSLAKIVPDTLNPNILNWKAYLATELKYLSTLYGACIVAPTDLRKINDCRRPTNDDLKDAAELAYEANCVLLGFNELSIKNDAEDTVLKWTDEENNVWPILELNLSKNKKTLFRGSIRFKFYPPTSDFIELDLEEEGHYQNLMKGGADGPKFKLPDFARKIDLGSFSFPSRD